MTRSNEQRQRNQHAVDHAVIRYVITHLNKDGDRVLFGSCQGRNTSATREEANARLNAIMLTNGADVLGRFSGLPLQVRPCKCYPNHFDPIGIYFPETE